MTKHELNEALMSVDDNLNCVEFQEVKASKGERNQHKKLYLMEIEEDYKTRKEAEKFRKERKSAFWFLAKVLMVLTALAILVHVIG